MNRLRPEEKAFREAMGYQKPPFWRNPRGGWKEGWLLAAVLVIVGAAVAAIFVIATDANYRFAVQGCRHWSEAIGRPAHEVRYTWGTWDCLTPNPARPGTWIPTHNLFVVNR